MEPGELPGKLAGNQAGLWWKPACVSSEVHPNRDAAAKHFAHDKSVFSDKNLCCWKSPSQCFLWHSHPFNNNNNKETGCVTANVNGLHHTSLPKWHLENETSGISVWFFRMSAEGSALLACSVSKCKSNGEMLDGDRAILLYPSFLFSFWIAFFRYYRLLFLPFPSKSIRQKNMDNFLPILRLCNKGITLSFERTNLSA